MIRGELVAFSGQHLEGLSGPSGAIIVDPVSGAYWLHHAPGRWLEWIPAPLTAEAAAAPDAGASTAPSAASSPWCEAALAAGQAAWFDIAGRYAGFEFSGEAAQKALAFTLNLEVVLPADRDCAAVALFDCPAVLARTSAGFVVWVSVSHVADFTAAVERAGHICAKL